MSSSTDASPPAVPYEPYNDDLHFMEFPREEGDLSSDLDGRTTWDAGVTCVGSFKEDARALVDGDVPEGPIDSATVDQTYHEGHGVCAFCRFVFAQPVVKGSRPEVMPNALQTPFLKILDWRYVQFEVRLLDRVQGEYNLNTPLARIRAKIVEQLQEMKKAMED
ncbi:hypothetical protein EG328_004098 [Venturia inaequalis]|uniref:Uncharacterized protein n=1 Tax=Venturia inaequalis TaxID=5025 RepID=A0A8H3ZC58_VENIN|nr:hypothetical protein EG328_004098 [Venturia inaequalis]